MAANHLPLESNDQFANTRMRDERGSCGLSAEAARRGNRIHRLHAHSLTLR